MTARTMCRLVLAAAIAGLVSLPSGVSGAAGGRAVRKDVKVEDLGAPCQRRLLWDNFVYRAKDTGHLHLYLSYSASNQRGGDPPWQLVDFDLETGEARTAMGSPGGGGRAFMHSNGKLYTAAARPPTLVEYDPATGKTRILGRISQDYYAGPQSHYERPDGTLFIGTFSSRACRYHPKTDQLVQFGEMGEPGRYVYNIGADDRYVYCGMGGRGRWFLVVYDMQTGKQTSWFRPEPGEKSDGHLGRTADGRFVFGTREKQYLLEDGKPVALEKKLPPDRSKPENFWPLTTAEAALGLQVDLADAQPTNWNGGTVAVRWKMKDEKEWRSAKLTDVDIRPTAVCRMAAAPDGTFIGATTGHGLMFRFDPETGKSTYLGSPVDSTYDILVAGDMAYFSGYASVFSVYRWKEPWTQSLTNPRMSKDQNPYRLTSMKWTTHLALGADGRIYAGGRYGRHHSGGGLVIFDPKTGQYERVRETFTGHAVADVCAMGPRIVISASAVTKEGRGRILVYDTKTKAFVGDHSPLPEQRTAGNIFPAGGNAVIGVIVTTAKNEKGEETPEWRLYKIDVDSGKVLLTKKGPGRAFMGPLSGIDFRRLDRRFAIGPDGCGWFFIDKWLTRIHPDGTVEKIRELPHAARLTFHGDDLYLYSGGRQFFGRYSAVLRMRDMFEK